MTDNIGGCPECGYFGSRTWTVYEDGIEVSITECQKCGYREGGMVDELGNTRVDGEWSDLDEAHEQD
jgi:Zn ribbon nucleic-acid-binding protein